MSNAAQLSPRAAGRRAHMAISEGRPRDAMALVRPFLDAEPLEDRDRALLLVARGNARSDLDEFRGSLDDLEEARRLHEDAGRVDEAGMVEMEVGITLGRMGRPAEALQRHERAIAAYSEHGDALDVARCRLNVAGCYADLGDHDRERAVLEQARAVFAEHGEGDNVLSCTFNLALADLRVGRLREARDAFEELVDEYASRGMTGQLADAKDELGWLLHEFGELERSVSLHEDAAAIYEVLGLQEQRSTALVLLAHAHGHAGHLDRADETLDAAAEIAVAPGSLADVAFERAWASIRRGRPGSALEILEELERIDRARGAESALPYRLWTEGAALASAGEHTTAIDRLERAVTGLRALGMAAPFAEATRELGLARRAAGDHGGGIEALRSATRIFAGCGLERRAEECRADLPDDA